MPVYAYYCKDCPEQTVSVARGINEPELSPICIQCGHQMVREYGLSGVAFRGTGFYSSDK